MEQPSAPEQGPEDVLSMGEESSNSRWVRLGAVLLVLLVGFGGYRLVSGPSSPGAPDPAAAASQDTSDSSLSLAGSGRLGRGDGGTPQPTRVRLGGRTVALEGAGLQQAHRETSARALGRLRTVWLIEVTSRACEDRTDEQVLYGVARASGRFTLWEVVPTARRPTWRSPDGALVLKAEGWHLLVRRAATGDVLADFGRAAARRAA